MSVPEAFPEHHPGGCLCGAVTFEVTGPLPPLTACHCTRCRTWSGHVWAAAPVPLSALRLTREAGLRWHRSSATARRGFCTGCGASLFLQHDSSEVIEVAGGAFDGPTGSHLAAHRFPDCAGDYYAPAAPPPLNPAPSRVDLGARCLCGGVRFTLPGPAGAVTACHCTQCRKLSGHFSASFDVAESTLVYAARIPLATHVTPGGGTRGYCRDCGSSLWFRARDGGFSVEAGAIEGPTGGQMESHIFTAEKGDYYDIADGLPQHAAW